MRRTGMGRGHSARRNACNRRHRARARKKFFRVSFTARGEVELSKRTRALDCALCAMMRALLLLAAAWLAGLMAPALASLMAIDLGGEFLKVSVVAPGRTPISIAINEMSKRKTPVVVGFLDDQRVLGEAAVTAAGRHPDKVIGALRDLLGRPAEDPSVRDLLERYHLPYKVVSDPDRRTVRIALNEGSQYSIEALVVSVPVSSALADHAPRREQTILTIFADSCDVRRACVRGAGSARA
jgi:Hsp70 protein